MQSFEPKNPDSVKPIIVALSRILTQFAEPDHRWLVGKNTVQDTGVFVRQNRADLNMYSLIFFTPDDIRVLCKVNMAAMIKNPQHHTGGLIVGVCDYLTQKRGHDKIFLSSDLQQVVDSYIAGGAPQSELIH